MCKYRISHNPANLNQEEEDDVSNDDHSGDAVDILSDMASVLLEKNEELKKENAELREAAKGVERELHIYKEELVHQNSTPSNDMLPRGGIKRSLSF